MSILRKNFNLSGLLYFYIHFVTEVLSFYYLASIVGDHWILWLAPFIYDILAFVPQFLIGTISDRFPKIPFGIIGIGLLMLGLSFTSFNIALSTIILTIIIALGNACVHVNGAEVTLRSSHGKIFPAALFVAGGSFGVITGKLLVGIAQPWLLILLGATAIPVILVAEKYRIQADKTNIPCKEFKYANPKLALLVIALLAGLVVAVRGYVGYGIPTSWNKSTIQTIMLFSFMGIGKALGGLLVDKIGIRKTAFLSMLAAIPFLILGDQNMYISLIGVMFFSMTMAITLAILVSAFPESPGFAFGITTVGLALGSLPVFFVRISDVTINSILLIVASLLCLFIILKITRKDKKHV
jgi:hypothetical protein